MLEPVGFHRFIAVPVTTFQVLTGHGPRASAFLCSAGGPGILQGTVNSIDQSVLMIGSRLYNGGKWRQIIFEILIVKQSFAPGDRYILTLPL